ncbi:MAG: hypothetical protein V1685_03345 [Parcubacteria group bacterium]
MRFPRHQQHILPSRHSKYTVTASSHRDRLRAKRQAAARSRMTHAVLIIFAVGSIIALSGCTKPVTNTAADIVNATTGVGAVPLKQQAEKDLATAKAKELWRALSLSGEDLSSGPCLTNEAVPGWVADIAHNPRQSVDNLPENQCSAFRDGTATHFVELDEGGNLIQAQ